MNEVRVCQRCVQSLQKAAQLSLKEGPWMHRMHSGVPAILSIELLLTRLTQREAGSPGHLIAILWTGLALSPREVLAGNAAQYGAE